MSESELYKYLRSSAFSDSELLEYMRKQFGVSLIYGKHLCRLAGLDRCPDELRPSVILTVIDAAVAWQS